MQKSESLNYKFMPAFTILLVLTVLASIVICYLVANRLLLYTGRYKLPESKYTKIFKIITKEHVLGAYIFFIVCYAIFTIWFLITL